MPGSPEVRVFDTPEAVTREAFARVVATAEAAIKKRGRFRMCLSGGKTPEGLYRALSDEQTPAPIPFDKVDFFLGDERRVRADDPRSNALMIREVLLRGPAARARFHPLDGANPDPDAAALDYEMLLRHRLGPEGFDLMLLGMGPDGHTASLFPRSPGLWERSRFVLPVAAPTTVEPHVPRLTLTPLGLLNAERILLLICGEDKAEALAKLRSGEADDGETPVRLVRRFHGVPHVLCDRAAAGPATT
jgi:6-phosphogluconolactonase